jgi:hypothetical protein
MFAVGTMWAFLLLAVTALFTQAPGIDALRVPQNARHRILGSELEDFGAFLNPRSPRIHNPNPNVCSVGPPLSPLLPSNPILSEAISTLKKVLATVHKKSGAVATAYSVVYDQTVSHGLVESLQCSMGSRKLVATCTALRAPASSFHPFSCSSDARVLWLRGEQ